MPSPISLRLGDTGTPKDDTGVLPVVIVLDRLRSAFNVGNILRVAEAVRAQEILACGYTPCPPHEKLAKTARGCEQLVPCRHFETAADAIDSLHRQHYTVYAIDTVCQAKFYYQETLSFPLALVFGNEALGISQEALQKCDGFLQLPARGCKNSINVGNCAAVLLFETLRQFDEKCCKTRKVDYIPQ